MDEERKEVIPEEAPKPPEEIPEPPREQAPSPEPVRVTIKQRLSATPIVFRLILAAVLVAVLIGLFFVVRDRFIKNKDDGKLRLTSIEIQIAEVLHTARLNTTEYMYKGVVSWFFEEEDGQQTKVGFIKYSGKIKYGVEFDEIKVKADEEKNTIVITIPPLIREPYVEEPECIFLNQSTRARFSDSRYMDLMQKACIDHITYKADTDAALEEAAEKYTKELVESLTSPFFEADKEISYEIRMGE